MQATGNALGAAAAGPPAGPTLETIMEDALELLRSRDATMQRQLTELQQKAQTMQTVEQELTELKQKTQTMETVTGNLRVQVTTAKSAAWSHQKQEQQLVICIVLLLVCSACARCLR